MPEDYEFIRILEKKRIWKRKYQWQNRFGSFSLKSGCQLKRRVVCSAEFFQGDDEVHNLGRHGVPIQEDNGNTRLYELGPLVWKQDDSCGQVVPVKLSINKFIDYKSRVNLEKRWWWNIDQSKFKGDLKTPVIKCNILGICCHQNAFMWRVSQATAMAIVWMDAGVGLSVLWK